MSIKKQKKVRVNKILRPVSVWLLILFLQLIVNFDSICYMFNHSSYEEITAVVAEEKTDPYLLLVPMVNLQYQYYGQSYNADKFFVLQPFFGLSSEPGTVLSVYVNKLAPEYVIFHTNFFRNIVNWILVIINICCILRIYHLIRDKIKGRSVRKGEEDVK